MIVNEFQAEFVTKTSANENQLHIIVKKITDVKIKCGELYKTREMLQEFFVLVREQAEKEWDLLDVIKANVIKKDLQKQNEVNKMDGTVSLLEEKRRNIQ